MTNDKPKALTGAARVKRIRALFRSMSPVRGEVRVVYECGWCGQLFGRRYVPYGLGYGVSVGMCGCHLTQRNAPSTEVERREDDDIKRKSSKPCRIRELRVAARRPAEYLNDAI